jgi:hypothetical protein
MTETQLTLPLPTSTDGGSRPADASSAALSGTGSSEPTDAGPAALDPRPLTLEQAAASYVAARIALAGTDAAGLMQRLSDVDEAWHLLHLATGIDCQLLDCGGMA